MRGSPRIQYERTCVLLPPGAGVEWAVAVIDGSWDKYRFTLTNSADDAGIGDLDVRHVIAVNPSEWGDLRAFFEQHYPQVVFIRLEAETPQDLVKKLGDIVLIPIPPEPEPEPVPAPGEGFPLRGVHDRAGGDWLFNEELKGWCLVPVYLGTTPQRLGLLADPDIRFLVNLRYSYAVDDGGQGTMPGPDRLAEFEQACIETMEKNPEAWAFVYCNEMNNAREWPAGYSLTPEYYRDSYNRIWAAKPAGARLMPGAIDPYNAIWGDWRRVWRDILDSITDCDGLAWHAYTHGPEVELIWGERRFGDEPLVGVFYDLRVLEDLQATVPEQFADRIQVVTESNHLTRWDESIGWEADSGAWVREAFEYFASRGVAGACLFRFGYEDWRFGDLPEVLDALRWLDWTDLESTSTCASIPTTSMASTPSRSHWERFLWWLRGIR